MTDVGVAVEQVETGGRGALRMFLRNKAAVVGLVVFSLIVLVTNFGPGLSISLVGDGLQDAFNPKLRGR